MTKDEAIGVLGLLIVMLILFLTIDYTLFTDRNDFLKSFVGAEMLGFLGIILTLAIGMAAHLVVATKKLRPPVPVGQADPLLNEIRGTGKALIASYFLALGIVFAKSFVPEFSIFEAILNSTAIVIIVFFFMALSDIVLSLFDVES
jgi:hypothetical protein